MKTTIALALFACAAAAQAQTITAQLVKHYQTSKDLTLAVANAMPDASYSFKATSAEMSFGEQMNHIAAAQGHYCAMALGADAPVGKTPDNSKAAATKNLNDAFDFCIAGLQKLSDADLTKEMGSAGRKASVFELLLGGFTHTAHHRGQAEVYLRLKGITPPGYKF